MHTEQEKILKCSKCGRTYPESLGSCEFCMQMERERIEDEMQENYELKHRGELE